MDLGWCGGSRRREEAITFYHEAPRNLLNEKPYANAIGGVLQEERPT